MNTSIDLNTMGLCSSCKAFGIGKAILAQAWTGPECSRLLGLPDFKSIGT